ncbi:MAG: hypothetical protein HZB39_08525 [Planctomycetes bacterium]|nr:hypothetical protein [Planctomycetota bacterium]
MAGITASLAALSAHWTIPGVLDQRPQQFGAACLAVFGALALGLVLRRFSVFGRVGVTILVLIDAYVLCAAGGPAIAWLAE